MDTMLMFGVFMTLYGFLGIRGVNAINEEYKGTSFEKEYKKFRGISWLLIGIPWIAIHFLFEYTDLPLVARCLIISASAVPSIWYSVVGDKKYKKLFEEEKK